MATTAKRLLALASAHPSSRVHPDELRDAADAIEARDREIERLRALLRQVEPWARANGWQGPGDTATADTEPQPAEKRDCWNCRFAADCADDPYTDNCDVWQPAREGE